MREMFLAVTADDPAIILSSQTSLLAGVCSVCQVACVFACAIEAVKIIKCYFTNNPKLPLIL